MLPADTLSITNMRKNVSSISSANDCIRGPEGSVAPRSVPPPKRSARARLAAIAPAHWLTTYGATLPPGNRPAIQNPSVTAGLMCAPDTSPIAYMTDITVSPHTAATPACVMTPA